MKGSRIGWLNINDWFVFRETTEDYLDSLFEMAVGPDCYKSDEEDDIIAEEFFTAQEEIDRSVLYVFDAIQMLMNFFYSWINSRYKVHVAKLRHYLSYIHIEK